MLFREIATGEPMVRWDDGLQTFPEDGEDWQRGLNWFDGWTVEQLAAVKLYRPEDVAPPDAIPDGKEPDGAPYVARVNGVVKWVQPTKNIVVYRPTVAERKDLLAAAIASTRWDHETGGITADGATIRTDEVGQAKLTGAVTLFANDPTLTSIDWEAQPGVWVTLDKAAVTNLGIAVGRHIQACFSRARVLSEAVTAARTHADLDAVEADVSTGWPGQ